MAKRLPFLLLLLVIGLSAYWLFSSIQAKAKYESFMLRHGRFYFARELVYPLPNDVVRPRPGIVEEVRSFCT